MDCIRKFKFRDCVFLLCFSCFVQADYGLLPIKSCVSLESYEKTHRLIAQKNVDAWSKGLSAKITTISHLGESLTHVVMEMKREIAANEVSRSRIKEAFMDPPAINAKSIDSSINQLRNRLAEIEKEVKRVSKSCPGLLNCNEDEVLPAMEKYEKDLISRICTDIEQGDYSSLISSLPACLFVPAHVPNTFVCAFSLIGGGRTDIFVKKVTENEKEYFSATNDAKESVAFESGGSDKGFFDYAVAVQTSALSGSVSRNKMTKIGNTLLDLYRHSEQKCFSSLELLDFVSSVVEMAKGPVDEVVYHGNTIRDLCPNCRATLISHEILTERNLQGREIGLPDSFLCALQNKFNEKFNRIPKVTSIISSFVPYGQRDSDVTWYNIVPISLVDPNQRSEERIYQGFVNQFSFSERDFLELLVHALEKRAPAGPIMTAVTARLETISQ